MSILEDLLASVQIDDLDRRRLVSLGELLAPELPAIAARFYVEVAATLDLAALLAGASIERLEETMVEWMASGLAGPYDDEFDARRSRIGNRHVAIGLAQHHVFTAINILRGAYFECIAARYAPAEALLVLRSVEKLFDIELALMLQHYQLASEAKLVARERAIVSDRIAALQTMSTGLAHEIRNPLNSAKLQLELLDRRAHRADTEKLREPIALARHEIARLTGLLDDFLAFADVGELERQTLDVVVVARQAVDQERPFAASRDCRLGFVADPEIIEAHVDARRIHQIVQQLVRNALEAARTSVTVRVSRTDALRIEVSDDGAGIPEALRPRIFEPFFTTKQMGTGMGLALVHSFVTMHGGALDLDTGASGTTVRVTL